MPRSAPPRILVVGYHGSSNFGDDLFLRIVCEQLYQRIGPVELVVSTNNSDACPKFVGCRISGAYPEGNRIRRLDWLRLLFVSLRSDGIIFCGGSIFAGKRQAAFSHFLSTFRVVDRLLARQRPIFGVGLSLGPFENRNARLQTQNAIRCFDRLIVRDHFSINIAITASRGGTDLSPDIALALLPEYQRIRDEASRLPSTGVSIGVFIGPGFEASNESALDKLVDGLLSAASKAGQEIRPTVFVTCRERDVSDAVIGERVFAALSARGISARIEEYSPLEPKKFIARLLQMDGIVSSRLHPALVAMSVGIPVLQVDSGHPKIREVFALAGFRPASFSTPTSFSQEVFDSLFAALDGPSKAVSPARLNAENAKIAHERVKAILSESFDDFVRYCGISKSTA